ncbi:MAG: hypothetical protein ONB05_06840 [candidate division KSB1 bacterium]|nr:hypothetical protein [candidate division KSB1 bacterium]
MFKILAYFGGSLILLTPVSFAQTDPRSRIDSLILQSIELTIEQKYDEAQAKAQEAINMDKDNPIGYLFQAASLQSMMMDYESLQWKEQFDSLLNMALDVARRWIKKDQDPAWGHFCSGSALCYKAFFLGREKEYFSALHHCLKGVAHLERALSLDSTLYDAYLGIGSYKYWRSRKTRILNWLPFIKDERLEGIDLVRRTVEKGMFSRYAAINGLAWMLMDAGRIQEAINIANLGHEKFPESRFFLWCLAQGYFKLKDYRKANHYYQQILSSLLKEPYNNHYNEIICRYKIAYGHFQLEQYAQAVAQCDTILALKLDNEISHRSQGKIESTVELKRKCENRY